MSSSRTHTLVGTLVTGALVTASVAAHQPESQKPIPQPSVATPASATDPGVRLPQPLSESEIALACASTLAMLKEYQNEKNLEIQAEILRRADKRIRGVVSDPRVESLEAWRIAGVIAVAKKDVELGAFAFEAIERLKPQFVSDDKLLKVMGALDAMEVQQRVAAIRLDREQVLELARLAENGNADGQFDLGLRYANGVGVLRDDAKAVVWYRKAADQGLAPAQFHLGVMYNHGRGVPKDEAEAVKLYLKAAHQGYASSEFYLGIIYAYGESVPKNYAEAALWLRRASDRGVLGAKLELGRLYLAMHKPGVDPAKKLDAAGWLERAAKQGSAAAQYELSDLAVNPLNLLTKAAEQGHRYAEYNLGRRYAKGTFGVPKNSLESRKWLRKAADSGSYHRAAFDIWKLDCDVENLPRNADELYIDWCRKRSAENDPFAQLALGYAYKYGHGVSLPADQSEAASWFRKAAEREFKSAQRELGFMYLNGTGVPQDVHQAVDLLRKAADQGDVYSLCVLAARFVDGELTRTSYNESVKALRNGAHLGFEFAQSALRKVGETW